MSLEHESTKKVKRFKVSKNDNDIEAAPDSYTDIVTNSDTKNWYNYYYLCR